MNRRTLLASGAAIAASCLTGCATTRRSPPGWRDVQIQILLATMTLEEKAGQLHQAAGGRSRALNSRIDSEQLDLIRRGGVGSYLHVAGAEFLHELQRVAVEESRLKIPLLFAMDVVHGYRTIYPVSLGMAASFDPGIVQSCARMAATEASVSGLHWTFAPMIDIARDPRWGRVVEGAGEDPHLGAAMAEAQVLGFQTDHLGGDDTILATAKHFGAYGAGLGGRDYDSADLSQRSSHEIYLAPFHAAVRAGAGAVMTAFNDIGGAPTTANRELLHDTLRDRWGFNGFVVSDWNAIAELMNHGIAETRAQAAALALRAGVDMDMMSGAYAETLAELVRRDPSLAPLLDEAVSRILWTKVRLGLFDNPYRFGDPDRERRIMLSPEHRALAREAARKAIVLLKNEGPERAPSGAQNTTVAQDAGLKARAPLLPLSRDLRRIAIIGALANDAMSALGSWRAQGKAEDVTTLLQSARAMLGPERVTFEPGASPESDDRSGIAAAVRAARRADLVLLVLGESFNQSGEARSRADLGLPGAQEALAQAIIATGKPIVLILMNGRPLALSEEIARLPAILETWFLGVESGPAITDILFGAVSPGGRLPIGFPRPGHSPEPYAHLPTGRPADPDLSKDSARYHDSPIGPLFPFGHGLGYSTFAYSDLTLDRAEIGPHDEIQIAITVTNAGAVEADEVVQLYLRDPLASISRPVKELRGFARVPLKPGESKRVTFRIKAAQMAFYDEGHWRIEAGRIDVMIGASSEDIRARGAFTITSDAFGSAPGAALPTTTSIDAVNA